MKVWRTTRFAIDLSSPRVMGIVNVTPDSFSDGGEHASTEAAIRHCAQLIEEGAHLLDIGGESTRPGSSAVPIEIERSRVLPVLREALRMNLPVSVDTCKPRLMQEALDLGADIVNDIWALRQPGALDVVAAHPSCGVCLMHMHRDPRTMQSLPMDGDAPTQVLSFLATRLSALDAAGVGRSRVVCDPGIGFGKTASQNFALLARQRELLAADAPLLVGWSRKSSLGLAAGLPLASDRKVPSIAAALMAVERGASVVRVHDVRDTVSALAVWLALRREQQEPEAEP